MCAGDYKLTEAASYDPVIAAIPVMVLVALAAFLSTYLLRRAACWGLEGGSGLEGAAGGCA